MRIGPIPFYELPLWRKVLLVLGVGLAIALTGWSIGEELTIYASAPDHPVRAAGQTYRVSVMHGYVRYVTVAQGRRFHYWAGGGLGSWCGAASFLVAFLVLATFRRKAEHAVANPPRGRAGP
jgi:hypothetical protein